EQCEGQGFAFRTLQQLIAQPNNAAPGIKDQCMRPSLHFDTRSVATVAHSIWPRRRVAAPYTPETQLETLFPGHVTSLLPTLPLKMGKLNCGLIISSNRRNGKRLGQ